MTINIFYVLMINEFDLEQLKKGRKRTNTINSLSYSTYIVGNHRLGPINLFKLAFTFYVTLVKTYKPSLWWKLN